MQTDVDHGLPRRSCSAWDDRGIAMITTLMVLMLMSALLVGFTAVVMSDQRFRSIDRDRTQSFYAASGGIEKLTADLGNLFFANVAPKTSEITTLIGNKPAITGVTYAATNAPTGLPASSLSSYYCGPAPKTTKIVGGNGYTIMFCTDATGNPVPTTTSPVKSGPYEGLIATQTPFQIDVTARTTGGGETHLIRTMEAVAIPVFQFGMFSDVDLSFFAGPAFGFGGRVHTNGNLFLSQGSGATLTLSDKVTAVKEIIRQRLQNGVSIDTAPAHDGTISAKASPTTFRNLARTEGSLLDGLGSAENEPTWHTVSLSGYNNWIRSGRTGAKALNLPLVTVGGINPDLIRRPPAGEDAANPILFSERLFGKASLRILLSDKALDITNLPTVTVTAPISLGTTLADANWNATPPAGYVAPPAGVRAPIARTPGPLPVNFTVRNTQAAGWTNLQVNNIPASFLLPVTFTVTKGATVRSVSCTGRTATTFTGCTNPATPGVAWTGNLNSPASVTTAVNSVNFTSPAANMTANWPANTKTITVDSTASFAQGWFFVTPNGATAQMLVQCTGYETSVPLNANAPILLNCATQNGVASIPRVDDTTRLYTDALSDPQNGTLGGFLKIELQDTNKVWRDVTMEILNYGISGSNLDGTVCADPSPNAILRIQRLRDNGGQTGAANINGGGCNYAGSTNASDYWPNVLFDPREALQRDVAPAGSNVILGGVMYYMTLDVRNLALWFRGTAPFNGGSGANAIIDNTGFTVYFSDRRNNRTAANLETGEYGFEDFVNPSVASGAPNAILDVGEDVNDSKLLDTYGAIANYNGGAGAQVPGALAPLVGTASPNTSLAPGQARVNRAILFRHALKLVNGSNIAGLGVNGLTVVAENPVYLQGDWNATGAFNDPHAATAIIADAVTLLSNNWNDAISFTQPYSPGNRNRVTPTWYRVAIIGGKGMAFPQPAATATDFGTDGGAHNFLRYLEDGDQAVNYRGSIATFFYNRQAVGTFKCCTTVYIAPTRNYAFDIDFLDPAKLPPNTPVFRDMNAVGFSQELRPGR
ncbi:MAG: pilus assembly PilX N-terminal domain-containing protein [Acidobacteriota bacterium]